MARAPRTYRAPIVVTLAAALLPSCSSGGPDDGTGGSAGSNDGGSASGGKGHTGGTSSGGSPGAGGTTTVGGQASGGGPAAGGAAGQVQVPSCPNDYFFPQINCIPEARCEMAADCTSGEKRSFFFSCASSGDRWEFEREDCENPSEYCAATGNTICVDDGWLYQGQGGNPPGPCPRELPAEGSDCSAGSGFGADRDSCGYPCGDAWTVIGCVAANLEEPIGEGSWESDGACSGGGADGG